ncbi:Zinc finger BED domain-containing protein 5 [Trichinella murrelli]|uniref:Zinc finger BED domain-containing protein 5 n=1 Tax=Trichinella murrelli TaxID=144512 RepID=A0A0V0T579_9BILA|nr:Zinc finger BED domain-containing protein 5 [Trichinella murrelli]
MCLIERSRRSLSRRAQYASALCRSLGMDEWLIRKPVKREVAEMESQKGSTAAVKLTKSNKKYDIDFLKFGFTWNGDHKDPPPLCVICYEILANESMRPNKLLRHIKTKHIDLKSKPLQFFESKLIVYMPLFPHGNPKFGALLKYCGMRNLFLSSLIW